MFVSKQDRVVNLILIGCNIFMSEEYQRINMNYRGYIKSNKHIRKSPAARTMNFELCKFPCVHLTPFRLV